MTKTTNGAEHPGLIVARRVAAERAASANDTDAPCFSAADDEPPDCPDNALGSPEPPLGDDSGAGRETPELTTWEPVELGPWLRGEVERPAPSVGMARSDGQRVIYPGREHAILGETESGKTWFALACAASELAAGNRVVYLHYEEGDPGSTVERLELLGVDAATMTTQLQFVAPSRPVRPEWLAALLDPAPTLVVHDGVNEAMALHGAEIIAAEGVSAFRRRLIAPCLRVGAATLSCDHMPMARDGSRRDAYGSVHKGNALDGARIVLENTAPFGRGLRGVSSAFVTKDRPGHLRAAGRPTKIPGKTFFGTLIADDSDAFQPFSLRFVAPRDDEAAPTSADPAAELADAVYDLVAALPGRTVASMQLLFAEMRKAGHSVRERAIRDAVADMTASGRVIEVHGKRGARGYRAVSTSAQRSAGGADDGPGPDLGPDLGPLKEGPGAEVGVPDVGPVGGRGGPGWADVDEKDGGAS